jgi:hypothetical protein
MGLFDFLKSGDRTARASAARTPHNYVYKSGKHAIEYIRSYMRTEWKANSQVFGLLGHPTLEDGILTAEVLIPKGDDFIAMPTQTPIKAVHSPHAGRMLLNDSSDIRLLDLNFGDLVFVLLAEQHAEFRKLYPETEGWVAFIIGKSSLTYNPRESSWVLEKKYEL